MSRPHETARQHDAVMGVLYRRFRVRDDALVREVFAAIRAATPILAETPVRSKNEAPNVCT